MRELRFREYVNGIFHYWGFVEEGIFKGPATSSLTRGNHDQFIGIIDSKGKDIYENDVVIISNVKSLSGSCGVAKFINGSWRAVFKHHKFLMSPNQYRHYKFEVIGNTRDKFSSSSYEFIVENVLTIGEE